MMCDVPSTVSEDKSGWIQNGSVKLAIAHEPFWPEGIWVLVYLGVMHARPSWMFSNPFILQ